MAELRAMKRYSVEKGGHSNKRRGAPFSRRDEDVSLQACFERY
jgi:hypothetical protein